MRVEIIDEYGRYMKEGQCGRIYVSTMHNRVMPFEEYGIGDLGEVWKRAAANVAIMGKYCT